MTFVNENLNSEKRKKYDPNDQFLTNSRRWSIDRDTETFIASGGMARMDDYSKYMYIEYILFWQKEYILFYAEYYFNSETKPKNTMIIKKIKIPIHMQINKEELFALMKKALNAYAGSGEAGRENAKTYIFDFSEVQ